VAWIRVLPRAGRRKSWKVFWRDPGGQVRTKTFRRERDAKTWTRSVEVSKDKGSYIDPKAGQVRFGTYFEHHLNTAPHLKPYLTGSDEGRSQWKPRSATKLSGRPRVAVFGEECESLGRGFSGPVRAFLFRGTFQRSLLESFEGQVVQSEASNIRVEGRVEGNHGRAHGGALVVELPFCPPEP
jgi:hypothetical protein